MKPECKSEELPDISTMINLWLKWNTSLDGHYPFHGDSDEIMVLYKNADDQGKKLIDEMLVWFCGYNMRALMLQAEVIDSMTELLDLDDQNTLSELSDIEWNDD